MKHGRGQLILPFRGRRPCGEYSTLMLYLGRAGYKMWVKPLAASRLPRSAIWRIIAVNYGVCMDMIRTTEAELQRGLGALAEKARHEPVTITKDGRDDLVLLSAEEYARLKRRDRRVGLTEELSEEWIEAVRSAKVPDEFAALDAELK
jgi:prevent-host-death family protein